MRRRWARAIPTTGLMAAIMLAVGVLAAACGSTGAPADQSSSGRAPVAAAAGVQPMTDVAPAEDRGYFSDPYVIHRDAADASAPLSISGTTREVLTCDGQLRAGCFTSKALTVRAGPALVQAAAAHGSVLRASENNNIYQSSAGAWEMAATMSVRHHGPHGTGRWTVIVHAHPAGPTGTTVPTAWVADSLLVGSLSRPAKANYDGKYDEAAGHLYLVYSKRISIEPDENGVVAQDMSSYTQPTATPPQVLLGPDNADGGYASELFFGLHQASGFRLIETGNITEVDGKYVMAYSTGDYDQPDYKVGLAWSDTFLPPAGGSYKRVLKQDTTGIWGQGDHTEVLYLLQSQEPAWPNDVAPQVLAPGVPTIVDDHGVWLLCFAGFLPSDAPTSPATGHLDGARRRPFYLRLDVDVPRGATVAGTSGFGLDDWITAARS